MELAVSRRTRMTLVPPRRTRVRRNICLAAGLLAVWALMVWNDWNAALRFDSPTLDAICLLGAYSLPWFSMALVLWGSKCAVRLAAVGLLVPPILFTLVFAPFVVMHLVQLQADGDRDTSFEPFASVPVEGGRVAIYRTDCGATCAVGIAVRQERRLFWRLLLVRHLGGYYRANEARYEALGPRRVRVSVPPYVAFPGNPTRSDVYEITPWVYF